MLTAFRKFLAPPVFENEEKTRAAARLNILILFILVPVITTLPITIFFGAQLAQSQTIAQINLAVTLVSLGIFLGLRFLLFKGAVYPVAWIVIFTNWVSVTYLVYQRGSVSDLASLLFILSTLVATLIISRQAGFISFAVTSGIIFTLSQLEQTGQLPQSAPPAPLDQFIYFFAGSLIVVAITSLIQNDLFSVARRARENESAQQAANANLRALQTTLEQRVTARTVELERRAAQLQIVSNVASAVASIQDADTLLPFITKLVSERFGFYHTGIFLLDEAQEFAVLRAANSEGGAIMLKRQHKLRLDANSIVGYVASRGEPRIALDVGTDMVFFNNPDLPNTRSEMALPLRIAGNTIGVLDIQSEQPNAYSEEDISTLSTLADQVAVAIENARLLSQAREALKESERAFETYIQQEWKSFALQVKSPGYLFDGEKTVPLASTANIQQVKSLPQTGRLSLLEQGTNEIGYPIKLRGKTIGILNVKPKQGNRQWTKDELVLLEAAAERAALALENARLVESAQRRAARERAIGDISVKIGAVSGLEAILQTAVEELGRKIGGSTEVIFEFGDVEDQAGHQ